MSIRYGTIKTFFNEMNKMEQNNFIDILNEFVNETF